MCGKALVKMMEANRGRSLKKIYLIVFITAFSNIVYIIPYLSLNFYTQFLEAYNLTDGQMGFMMSFFGMTAIPGYLIGGWIADIFNPKKLVILSCVATGVVAIGVALSPSYGLLLVLYGFYGITSTCLHWGAYLKVIRTLGNQDEQGRLYGVANTGYQMFSLFLQYVILAVLVNLMNSSGFGFRGGVLVYAAISIVIGLLILKVVPNSGKEKYEKDTGVKLSLIGKALKMPMTWYLGIFTLSYFIILMSLPYVNPYLSSSFGISVAFATVFAVTARTGSIIVMAPVGGFIRDKVLKGKSTRLVLGCAVLSMIFAAVMTFLPRVAVYAIPMMIVAVLAYLMTGTLATTLYTPLSEAKVPIAYTGTILGIASAIGYSSDAWLYNLCGQWIDNYGEVGYRYIWGLSIFAGFMMLVTGVLMWRCYRKAAQLAAASTAN